MEDVRRRRDRVAAVEDRATGLLARRHEAQGRRLVAGDVPVVARRKMGRCHPVVRVEHLGRLAKGVTGLQRPLVRLRDDRLGLELVLDPAERRIHAPLVQPEHQAEGEEVLRQVHLLGRHLEPFEGPAVEGRDGDREDGVLLERTILERVCGVADLVEVRRREGVLVDDERAAGRQVADVRLECRRVHRDEDVRLIARSMDVLAAEADLEAADAGQRAGRRPDLGREVGERADIVAEDRGRPGELGAGQLHPVAGIAGEANGDALEILGRDLALSGGHAPSECFICWCGRGGRLSTSSGKPSAR